MNRACILFTRVPKPGKTKTRLMPTFTPEACAEIHEAFLEDIYLQTKKISADVFVNYTPEDTKEEALRLWPGAKEAFPQKGKNLGERMQRAMETVLSKGYDRVLLFGSDLPEITEEILETCFESLDEADVVLAPTTDGGYYLVGMKKPADIFNLKAYSHAGVFEDTVLEAQKSGLTVKKGPRLCDIDTPEDVERLLERIKTGETLPAATGVYLISKACMHCGKCKTACAFLDKYEIDLKGLAERSDLAYNCFLCNTCREVCPLHIDGRLIALLARRRQVLQEGGMEKKRYRMLRYEKDPYRYANYRKADRKTVLFTGCNFPAFYPKLINSLIEICARHNIGIVHDCCTKPIFELGLKENSDREVACLKKKLLERGVTELVFLCPSCYYFLKDRLPFKMTTIYAKLAEIGEGERLAGKLPYYAPCPDRKDGIFEQDLLKGFVPEGFTYPLSNLQCCGLGGCACSCEPQLAKDMAKTGGSYKGKVYMTCASCAGNFKRAGNPEAEHILTLILQRKEKLPPGLMPFFNRAKWKWRRV